MPKSNKSHDRNTKNGRPNGTTKNNLADRKRETEVDLLTPEQWVHFGESLRLTDRELEVLILTSRDLPRKVIARELHISLGAVHTYCNRLHKKTNANGRVALLLQVIRFLRRP